MELIDKNIREDIREFKNIDPREIPCKDMDIDCLALDGVIPFGDYNRCYLYDPSQGRCPFAGP